VERTCSTVSGVDFFGNDLLNKQANNAENCIPVCLALDGCSHFSYVFGKCYFKSSGAGMRWWANSIGGVCP
jgi:hypothetical protein